MKLKKIIKRHFNLPKILFISCAVFFLFGLEILSLLAIQSFFFTNKNSDDPCAAVVNVLQSKLIVNPKSANDYLDRAKVFNRLSLDSCDDNSRDIYWQSALKEIKVADSLALLNGQSPFWKERAGFYRSHTLLDNEMAIYA